MLFCSEFCMSTVGIGWWYMEESCCHWIISDFSLGLSGRSHRRHGIAMVSSVTCNDFVFSWIPRLKMELPRNFKCGLIRFGSTAGKIGMSFFKAHQGLEFVCQLHRRSSSQNRCCIAKFSHLISCHIRQFLSTITDIHAP